MSRSPTGMSDIGYRTRADVLLNIQCATCGVWVAVEGKRFIEYDGLPHACKGTPYGKAERIDANSLLGVRA